MVTKTHYELEIIDEEKMIHWYGCQPDTYRTKRELRLWITQIMRDHPDVKPEWFHCFRVTRERIT